MEAYPSNELLASKYTPVVLVFRLEISMVKTVLVSLMVGARVVAVGLVCQRFDIPHMNV